MTDASPAEKHVFGAAAQIHPITKMALETGSGSLPADQQAQIHCDVIEHHHGKHAAEEMRAKLKASADLKTAEVEVEQADRPAEVKVEETTEHEVEQTEHGEI